MGRTHILTITVISIVAHLASFEAISADVNWLIRNEVFLTPFSSEGGHETQLAIPAILTNKSARAQLVGGTHGGSLRRDALRRERYAESIRQIVYQPDLADAARIGSFHVAAQVLGGGEKAIDDIDAFIAIAPKLVNMRYVNGGALAANTRNNLKTAIRKLNQVDGGATHMSRLLKAAPLVIEGGSLLNDFLLFKALATDAAEVRYDALQRYLVASNRQVPIDSALAAAMVEVGGELSALRTDLAWKEIADTFKRNRGSLVATGGKSIGALAIKRLGLKNPYLIMLGAELATVESLAKHHKSAQLATTSGTIAWRLHRAAEASPNLSHEPVFESLYLYAQYDFAKSMHATAATAVAKISDVLKFGRPYADIREYYHERTESILARLSGIAPPGQASAMNLLRAPGFSVFEKTPPQGKWISNESVFRITTGVVRQQLYMPLPHPVGDFSCQIQYTVKSRGYFVDFGLASDIGGAGVVAGQEFMNHHYGGFSWHKVDPRASDESGKLWGTDLRNNQSVAATYVLRMSRKSDRGQATLKWHLYKESRLIASAAQTLPGFNHAMNYFVIDTGPHGSSGPGIIDFRVIEVSEP